MLSSTIELLHAARQNGYAIGAFNVYNLEGVKATVTAAETERSPAMLQIHPAALDYGGPPLVALCLSAAREAKVPMAVHLDHSASPEAIRQALAAGVSSVMADGSRLGYAENMAFTRAMTILAHGQATPAAVEAELGMLSGTEDGLTVAELESKMTDPDLAADFVADTGIDALAVCIGNVHGHYTGAPRLDFDRLAAIRERVPVPLVLHGASGLPDDMIRRAIALGVRKFNVNTEVRTAYLAAVKERLAAQSPADLLDVMHSAVNAMQAIVAAKLRLFGSSGKTE